MSSSNGSFQNKGFDYIKKVDNMMISPALLSEQKGNSSHKLKMKEDTDSVISQQPPPHALPSRSENEIYTAHNNSGLMLSEQQLLIKAVDELCNRPRKGEMYRNALVKRKEIMKRLKFLSKKPKKLSIDEAIEICDASVLLKLMEQHHDIRANIDPDFVKGFKMDQELVNLAGQIANNGVLLMLQAKILKNKGRELLDLSKSKLQDAETDI